MKKTNNKGFSLVELIIVIAIMAVLIAVLAPQFLRYVERSRLQSDNTAIGEVANAAKVAMTDEDCAAEVAAGDVILTIPITSAGVIATAAGSSTATATLAEINATIGTAALTSNTYTGGTAPTITLHEEDGVITVTGQNYVQEVGAGAVTPDIVF